jgi:mannose-1-phosphate guanylyltransferase
MNYDDIDGLILAAGFGTRMGPLGKILPKALWPVFEKTLLEIQILKLKNLGIKNIYVNAHHRKEVLAEYIKRKNLPVKIIEEEEILGVGGAIYNIALNFKPNKKLLISNCDQIVHFTAKELSSMRQNIANREIDVCILLNQVQQKSQLNEVIQEMGLMKGINKRPVKDSYVTYCGIALIDMENLRPKKGFQAFFNEVARFEENKVAVVENTKNVFIDLGTIENYSKNLKRILLQMQLQEGDIYTTVEELKLVDEKKMSKDQLSYGGNEVIELIGVDEVFREINHYELNGELAITGAAKS